MPRPLRALNMMSRDWSGGWDRYILTSDRSCFPLGDLGHPSTDFNSQWGPYCASLTSEKLAATV